MYFVLKALARSLILPPGGPLLLSILGAVLVWRRHRPGWPLLVVGLASLWLLSTAAVADRLSRLAERCPPLDLNHPPDAQAVVILGGGGGRISAPEYGGEAVAEGVLLERLSYGALLAKRFTLPILVSGAPGEAITMRATLRRDFGIEPRWTDNQSHDTYENAHFSARILRSAGVTRIILVTSSAHEWRATREFRGVGLEVAPAPIGVLSQRETGAFQFIPLPSALMRSQGAIYELLGEPARQLQALLGVRERFDKKAALP